MTPEITNPHHLRYREIIDRLKISLPISSYDKFLSIFKLTTKYIKSKKSISKISKPKNWLIDNYIRNGKRIQVIKRIRFERKNYTNQRYYVQLLQPDTETQEYISQLLAVTVPKTMCKQFNASINEIEIAFDFFTDTDTEKYSPYILHEYFSKHMFLKYSRKGSVGHYKEKTNYLGLDGFVWKGGVGSRCYVKNIPEINDGKDFCRFEKQYKGKYLRKKGFTIDAMPFNAENFNALDNFEILDDFSFNEIRNIVRTKMRNKGAPCTPSTQKSMRFNIKVQILMQEIYSAFFAGDYLPVPQQIERCNAIKEKYGLTFHPKKHCQRLYTLEEFVSECMHR